MLNKFVIKVAIFSLIGYVGAFAIDFKVSETLKNTHYRDYGVWNEIFSGEIDADIVINGSSRALVHFAPSILDQRLGVNSYNLGMDGHEFIFQKCRFDIYTKYNGYPDVVLQVADHGIVTRAEPNELYGINQFLPYLDDEIMRDCTKNFVGLDWFDYYLPLVKYTNSEALELAIGIVLGDERYDQVRYVKGFLPKYESWREGTIESAWERYPDGMTNVIYEDVTDLFEEYIEDLIAHEVQVILVWPPEYIEGQDFIVNRDEHLQYFTDISNKYGLLFLDFQKHTLSMDQSYFYNSQHMNVTGVEIFMNLLVDSVEQYGGFNLNL
jgi:hypothetical protein